MCKAVSTLGSFTTVGPFFSAAAAGFAASSNLGCVSACSVVEDILFVPFRSNRLSEVGFASLFVLAFSDLSFLRFGLVLILRQILMLEKNPFGFK